MNEIKHKYIFTNKEIYYIHIYKFIYEKIWNTNIRMKLKIISA